jgi:Cu+-exporting ATPase
MEQEGVGMTEPWRQMGGTGSAHGETVICVSKGPVLLGMVRLGDALREDMPRAVADLRDSGVEVHLVSGDSQAATQCVAEKLGVDRCRGGVLPAEKVKWIRDLQHAGHRVGMVGDGANDAAALAAADVGFATGDALTVTKHASDVTILSFSGERLFAVMKLSRLTVRTVITNLGLAFAYNLVALPVALAGWVNPILAVIAMLLSSLTVVGNSARIARKGYTKG